MKRQLYMSLFALLIIIICVFTIKTVHADEYYRIDLLVLMDSSNSMRLSDPDKIRYQAFRDIAAQLQSGDRIGLVQFGADSRLTLPLTEITGKAELEKIMSMDIPDENLVYTDVKGALEKALFEINEKFDPEHLPFVIIFTDGDIQPILNYEKDVAFKRQYLEELKAITDEFVYKGWPVFAIDLDKGGKPVDADLKQVTEITGGYTANIYKAEDIQKTFRAVLESIRKKKVEAGKQIREENQIQETGSHKENIIPRPDSLKSEEYTGQKGTSEQKKGKTGIYTTVVLIAAALVFMTFLLKYITQKRVRLRRRRVGGILIIWEEGSKRKKYSIDLSNYRKELIHLSSIPYTNVDKKLRLEEELDITIYSEADGDKVSFYITGGIGSIIYTGEVPHKTLKLSHGLMFKIKSCIFYYDNPKIAEKTKKTGSNILKKYDNIYF